MYSDLKSRFKSDKIGSYFKISKGVRQGDPLSPILFNRVLGEIFQKVAWEEKGLDMDARKLPNLKFVDDMTHMADSLNDLRDLMHELNIKSKIAGLSINL